MKLKDIVELPVLAPTLNYEGLMLLDGHVVQYAVVKEGRTTLLALDRPESDEFITGFEVGLVMARLSGNPSTWRGTFHVVSGPMLERAAKALGYRMESGPAWAEGVWMFCDFFRLTAPESREES